MSVIETAGLMSVSPGPVDYLSRVNGIAVSFSGSQPKGVLKFENGAGTVLQFNLASLVPGQELIGSLDAYYVEMALYPTMTITVSGKCDGMKIAGITTGEGPTFSGSGHASWVGQLNND